MGSLCFSSVAVCRNHIQSPREFGSFIVGWRQCRDASKFFWECWMWMLFHVEDYLILPISCGIGRMERWIIQVLTVHRIILHIRNGRMLQSGLATDRIRGSTAAVLFVEFPRKRFQEAQSAKLNYFLCFIYLLLALSFASFFGYLFTQIN